MAHQNGGLVFEWLAVFFWALAAGRVLFSRKALPRPLTLPGKVLRFALIVVTFGLLTGCAGSDPLAVASGPIYPLNVNHWQPTPRDLSGPPPVANN